MAALFTRENIVSELVADGDAGVILKADGSFRIFTTGNVDPNNLEPDQLAQGEKLLAIGLLLREPQLYAMVRDMAMDPEIVGDAMDTAGVVH